MYVIMGISVYMDFWSGLGILSEFHFLLKE